MSTPVPVLPIHELVLQLVSDDTVGDWLGWADGREELAITLEDWEERVDVSSKGPPCAAFSLWGDTAPYHSGFRQCDAPVVVSVDRDRLAAILARGAEQADALQVRVWWSAHARTVLERREVVLRPHAQRLHGNKEA